MKVQFLALILTLLCTGLHAGPVRVLFLGHKAELHPSDLYYPMLAQALGRDGIYFDYVTTVEEALGDANYLNRFDALLLYANHQTIEPHQWENLKNFVEKEGKGFVPVHSASWCFQNEPGYDQLVGGRFQKHKSGVFTPRIIQPNHAAMDGVVEFEAWDETYVHTRHNPKSRTVLMVRDPMKGELLLRPEPWTWVRTQGKGRVFYTASGHDERVWGNSGFHQMMKAGILWSIGEERRATYEKFIESRAPLRYEKRDNIPNYEKRPEPLPWQFPLVAEESMKYTQAPMGFRLELFAAEPQIVNPMNLAWDERGRLWVIETKDYPNQVRESGGNDQIKILEDTDGDGRCDKVTIFAENLNIPTSLTFANGGVVVSHAPDFLFLKDIDGDDKADVREVILSGWGKDDTHAGPANLRYGFDNWFYGTVGYASFNGEIGGEKLRFGSGLYRFKANGLKMEFLHQFNNNTWGVGFNSDGELFGSTANNNPVFFCGLPATAYREGTPGMSAEMIADTPLFHPITPNIRQVDAFGAYTSAASSTVATSNAFPESWRDQKVFVCGPTGHLLGKYDLANEGSGFAATNDFAFLASADEWFSPVAAEVGPDGNLWVADWYAFIVQHNPTPSPERGGYAAQRGDGNAHINPNRDRKHGRIYRVVWEEAPEPQTISLNNADSEALVAALSDPNLFWRQTAQRLLVERGEKSVAPMLRALVRSKGVASIHALWTLDGLEALDRETHLVALISGDSALKRNAIRAIKNDEAGVALFFDTPVVSDADPRVRRVACTKLAMFPSAEAVKRAVPQMLARRENREDAWISAALKAAAANQGLSVTGATRLGPNLLPNPSFENVTQGKPDGWRPLKFSESEDTVFRIERRNAQDGDVCLLIASPHTGNGSDAAWATDVAVKPNTDYRLSGWIRTGALVNAMGALLNVHKMPGKVVTRSLRKKNDWTEVEVYFNSGDRRKVQVNCLFGGWGRSMGQAFYDNVALQEVLPDMTTEVALVGDVKRGEEIFRKHPVAGCIRCHKLGEEGGPIGPALDGIAARKSSEYLRDSLIDPMKDIAEGWAAKVSPMPPMGVLLKPQELEDVMAFLLTLE